MLDERGWTFAANVSDVAARPFKAAYPKGVPIVLIVRGEFVFALSNRCPHMGCPLSGGSLVGDTLVCPCHDWSFDIRTGELTMTKEVKLAKFEARVDDGKIFVKLED
ncbi:MAG: Rieske (2Fe-2S) protein [Methanomassiliicoccales archaeon]|jgi:3-phenylpropionate/trans-cinnamate dioxygenase ferredoxin subunit